MADYIVTTRKTDKISGFEIVRSVKDLTRLTSKSYLIFESSIDKDFDVAVFLISSIQSTSLKNIAYVSDVPSPIIDELMKSVGAYRVSMSEVVDNIENITMLMTEMSNFSQEDTDSEVSDNLATIDNYLKSSLEDKPMALKRQIESSFQSLVDILDTTVGSDILREQLQGMIIDFLLSKNRYEEELVKKERELNNLKGSATGLMSGVSSFQQYSYYGNARILVIKEYSPVRYLTSFLIAFAKYMTDIKTVKTKLVIIDRDSDMVDTRYSDIVKADSSTYDNMSAQLTLTQVVYTTTPTNSILDLLLNSIGFDLYIVLDRTYKRLDLITGRNITLVNAVSSRRLMRNLNFVAGETIVNDSGEHTQLAILSLIESYPKQDTARVDIQQRAFETSMKNIYTLLNFK